MTNYGLNQCEFDELYESIWSNIATGAVATGLLFGQPVKTMASSVGGSPTVETVAGQKSVAAPLVKPKSFEDFRDNYMYSVYHSKIDGLPMLSSTAETFAGPRFDMILAKFLQFHETRGKYTPRKVKNPYVVSNGVNYVQKLPDPSGGYVIGDGITLNKGATIFPELVKKYLKKGVAYDKNWNSITNSVGIADKIEFLRSDISELVGKEYRRRSRANLIEFLKKRGVSYGKLDAFAQLALEDLAYNVGGNLSYKKMLEALAKSPPDYVRAAYEICNSADYESFGGLRERRIHDAHLLLMAAERNNGLDIYRGKLGLDNAEPAPQIAQSEKTGMVKHTVVKGDTLWNLARKLHSTVDEIASENNLDVNKPLRVGSVIYVKPVKTKNMDSVQKSLNSKTPKEVSGAASTARVSSTAQYHTVSPGETFSGIAFNNKVKLNDLKRLNPGMNYNKIKVGQKVRIK